jgi:hypothetical protein
MDIEVVRTCPLGSTCEEVIDGKIHRCEWYVKLEGDSPQDGKKIETSKCAIAWQPILLIEGNLQNLRVSAAIESLRNETIKRQELAIGKINELQIPPNT